MSGDGVAEVLRANGLTDNPHRYDSSIHSWRCEYPDRYGPCSCFQDLVADLEGLIVKRQAAAYDAGVLAMSRALQGGSEPINPHRDEQ